MAPALRLFLSLSAIQHICLPACLPGKFAIGILSALSDTYNRIEPWMMAKVASNNNISLYIVFFSLFHGRIKVEIVYSTTKGGEPGNKTVEQSI